MRKFIYDCLTMSAITGDTWDVSTGIHITPGVRGAITGRMNSTLGGDDGARKAVISWVLKRPRVIASSKELSDAEWWALYQWMGFYKEESTGEWKLAPQFSIECALVLTRVLVEMAEENKSPSREVYGVEHSMLADSMAQLGGVISACTGDNGTWIIPEHRIEVKANQPEESPVDRITRRAKL